MAVLTVQKISKAGIVPTTAAAAGGGDSFPNTGREFIDVVNAGVGSINVTATQQNPCNQLGAVSSQHDNVVAVVNGTTKRIGPFDPNEYNDANGRVQLTYSGVTSVTVGVFAP